MKLMHAGSMGWETDLTQYFHSYLIPCNPSEKFTKRLSPDILWEKGLSGSNEHPHELGII
jgi:hypothetical protein